MSEKYTKEDVDKFLEELTALCDEHGIYLAWSGMMVCTGNDESAIAEHVDWEEGRGWVASYIENMESDNEL